MVVFKLRLENTYWSKGFFNVSVDFERVLSENGGPVDIYLGHETKSIQGTMTRRANLNATPRIFGSKALRDFFQSSSARNAEGDISS